MIRQTEALKALVRHRTEEIVVTAMSPMHEWHTVTNNPDLDLPVVVMGHAPTVGLGLALAHPERSVWILNGDGSQLMYLSSLATIVHSGVKNIRLFVFQNNVYESSGGQAIPLAERIDFGAIARGLGFRGTHRFNDVNDLESSLPAILRDEGPTLVTLHVTYGDPLESWNRPTLREATRFKQALQLASTRSQLEA